MRTLFFTFILAFASYGAVEIPLKYAADVSFYSYRLKFEANEELGRAWVELETSGDRYDGESDIERIKIDGLSYDDGEIVFERDGIKTVCAEKTVSGRWIFKAEIMKETGLCVLEEEKRTVVVDDGFYTRNVDKLVLKLVIL